jgi:molecular chaperone GrpE
VTDTNAGRPGGPDFDRQPAGHEPEGHGPTVRDRRRIDPVTGAVRPEAVQQRGASGGLATDPATADAAADTSGLADQLAERTADLQRVQAEYTNYRRRVDRDRDAVRQLALASALTDLLPVLDDIGRADEHGELVGGFKSVAERLDGALTKLGLVRFGAVGDPFDPNRHEALMHTYSDEVTETTCTQIFQPGYQLGERVLRPARVAVADPTEALPVGQDADAATTEALSVEETAAPDAAPGPASGA